MTVYCSCGKDYDSRSDLLDHRLKCNHPRLADPTKRPRGELVKAVSKPRTEARHHAEPRPKRPPAPPRRPAPTQKSFDHLSDRDLDRNLITAGMSPFMASISVADRYTAGGSWRIAQELTK